MNFARLLSQIRDVFKKKDEFEDKVVEKILYFCSVAFKKIKRLPFCEDLLELYVREWEESPASVKLWRYYRVSGYLSTTVEALLHDEKFNECYNTLLEFSNYLTFFETHLT